MKVGVISLIFQMTNSVRDFFMEFDWNSFWINSIVSLIFLLLSVLISIILIPHFTVRLLKRKRKKYIISKLSYIILEFCEFVESSSFKDDNITAERLIISTSKNDLKSHKFIGIINFNILNELNHLLVRKEILNYSKTLRPEDGMEFMKMEKIKLDKFRAKLESIIGFHSLDIDEEIISDVSQLCLDIRAFEYRYNSNFSIDDLIESGKAERTYVFGFNEIAEIYRLILDLFKKLISLQMIEVVVKKRN